MAIDPRLVFGLENPKLADPAAQQAQALNLVQGVQQARQGQIALQSGEMDLEQRKQDVADEQTLRQLAADTDGDLDEIVKRAAGKVSQKRLATMQQSAVAFKKGVADLAKVQADTGKTGLEIIAAQNQMVADEAAAVLDAKPERKQRLYLDARSRLIQKGLIKPNETPAEYPGDDVIGEFYARHAGAAKVYDREHKKNEEARAAAGETRAVAGEVRNAAESAARLPGIQADTELKQATAAGNAPVQPVDKLRLDAQAQEHQDLLKHQADMIKLTKEGQLMNDTRARELAELSRDAAKDARDNKPPTAAQNTVATYAARIKQAEDVIGNLGRNYYDRFTPDFMNTSEGQQITQAERNFINSVLRRESGAVISPSEFKEARGQYIPQPWDSEAVRNQKKANRLVVQESFKRAAGKAYEDPNKLIEAAGGTAAVGIPSVTTKAQYDALPAGTVYMEDGKKFKKP